MTMPDAEASLEIVRLGRHGDGVTADGGTFVPLALPGELVEGIVSAGRMETPQILRPSPDRAPPPCPYFGTCGGCSLQHAADPFVAAWKRARVVEALAAEGLECEVRPTATSPAGTRRRAVYSVRRTRAGATVGFHARRDARIVETETCLLVHPDIVGCREALGELASVGGSRKGEMKFAVAATEVGLDVDATGGKPLDAGRRVQLAEIAARAGFARLSWEGEPVAAPRQPELRFGETRAAPPPGAFLQATPEGERALVAAVLEAAGDGAGRVADLFAGMGTFSLPLAGRAEVSAFEADPAHVSALTAAWRGAGGRLKKVEAKARDLFRRPLTPEELRPFDAVAFDPPRAGAKAQCEALARSGVRRLAAVSCNPETFARDARILADGGYVLDWALPVDQFRWSAHVELAAAFRRP